MRVCICDIYSDLYTILLIHFVAQMNDENIFHCAPLNSFFFVLAFLFIHICLLSPFAIFFFPFKFRYNKLFRGFFVVLFSIIIQSIKTSDQMRIEYVLEKSFGVFKCKYLFNYMYNV